MAGRPKLESGKGRKKWSVLNVTDEERRDIEQRAKEARLPVSRYIIQAARNKSVTGRRDQREAICRLMKIEDLLETIAAPCRKARTFEDALPALLALCGISTAIDRITLGVSDEADAQMDETV